MKKAIIGVVLLLCACTGLSLEDQAFVLCSGYVNAYSKLLDYRRAGLLSSEMILSINAVRPIANGVCTSSSITDNQLSDLERAVKVLLDIRKKVEM